LRSAQRCSWFHQHDHFGVKNQLTQSELDSYKWTGDSGYGWMFKNCIQDYLDFYPIIETRKRKVSARYKKQEK